MLKTRTFNSSGCVTLAVYHMPPSTVASIKVEYEKINVDIEDKETGARVALFLVRSMVAFRAINSRYGQAFSNKVGKKDILELVAELQADYPNWKALQV